MDYFVQKSQCLSLVILPISSLYREAGKGTSTVIVSVVNIWAPTSRTCEQQCLHLDGLRVFLTRDLRARLLSAALLDFPS